MQANKKEWLFIATLMCFAACIRLRFNLPVNYLIAGGDGPYNPLQVRNLLEKGSLAFSDMPLLFMIEAAFAKLLQWLHIGNFEESILLSVKIIDSILPPLVAIPAYFIAKEFSPNKEKLSFLGFLMLTFAVLNFSTIAFFMNSCLQKNALGVVWIYGYLYQVLLLQKNFSRQTLYKGLFFLALCLFTHFGCFSLSLCLTFLLLIFNFIFHPKAREILSFKSLILAVLIVLALLSILYLFDAHRFIRLLRIPLALFQAPLILFLLDGQVLVSPMIIIHSIIYSLLAVFGLGLLLFYRKSLNRFSKIWAVTMIISALFLSSLLLGIEWSNRLNALAYIPISILYIILFQAIPKRWFTLIPSVFIIIVTLISLRLAFENQRGMSITEEAYQELLNIKNKEIIPKNTVMLGRQDLRLLSNWLFRVPSCADYFFKKEDFQQYKHVYLLKQLKGNNLTEARFKQKPIPANTPLIYKGEYFELYQIIDSLNWEEGRDKPLMATGTIIRINEHSLNIKNKATGNSKTIFLAKETQFAYMTNNQSLKEGMYVKVWGNRMPFSLAIKADFIKEAEEEDE